jgi:hypothetical protein
MQNKLHTCGELETIYGESGIETKRAKMKGGANGIHQTGKGS